MKFDPSKSYLHPVLRPLSKDYPHAEFQIEINLERVRNSTATRVTSVFELSDPDLLSLVAEETAAYVLLVRCPTTHFRMATRSFTPAIEEQFKPGKLSGRTEFCPFLVAITDVPHFQAAGWHQDFVDQPPFHIRSGSVLATDYPKEYWIDTAPEAPIGSIFELIEGKDLTEDEWCCDLQGERVGILMATTALERFKAARVRLNGTQDQAYMMNSVYLPALLHVMSTADTAPEDYNDRRWFRCLDAKLEEFHRPALGAGTSDRLVDAQKLLESPFAQLPFQLASSDKSGS